MNQPLHDVLDQQDQLTPSRQLAAAVATSSFLLSACGGGGSTSAPVIPPVSVTKPSNETEAARFLAQAGFGGDATARQNLVRNGLEPWLKEQFAMPQGLPRWDEISAIKISDPQAYAVTWQQTDNMMWKRIANSPDVLRQRMTLALSEIFVVNNGGVDVPAKAHAMCAYMDMLEKNAFGDFRQLLEDVSLHPAMGRMLGTMFNRKEDAATGRRPDENYAREVMQLFSIGLYELNQDGSIKTDANGQAKETYSQDDVSNLARVFTGWSTFLDWTVGGTPDPNLMRIPMTHDPKKHSLLEKKFLGTLIPAGTLGMESLKIALDTLANHANVGPFIGKQLIQRLVTSNPSPGYVSRVAAVFANNGQGKRGDLKAVLQAILLDTEAHTPPAAGDLFAGKWIEPMVRVGVFFRAFKFSSPDGQWRLSSANAFGQQPLNAPSVFNFFRPGYIPPNSGLIAQNKTAPELQIVSEQSVLALVNNFASLLDDPQSFTRRNYYDDAKVYRQDLKTTGLSVDFSTETAMATQVDALLEHLNLLLAAGQLSSATKQFIVTSVGKMSATDADPAKLATKLLNRVKAAILMVLVAPDSQLLK